MRWPRSNIVCRIPVNGIVRVNHVAFSPLEDIPYDGRLDGLKLAFEAFLFNGQFNPSMLFLRGLPQKSYHPDFQQEGPNNINGALRWVVWRQTHELALLHLDDSQLVGASQSGLPADSNRTGKLCSSNGHNPLGVQLGNLDIGLGASTDRLTNSILHRESRD